MDSRLPPPPKQSGVVQVIDLAGVTKLLTNGVQFHINGQPTVGARDALILKSYHILDSEFKKRLDAGIVIGGDIPGEIAWEITRQIGLGAPLVVTNPPATTAPTPTPTPTPTLSALSLAAAPASSIRSAKPASPASTIRSAKAAKPKRAAKKKTRKSRP